MNEPARKTFALGPVLDWSLEGTLLRYRSAYGPPKTTEINLPESFDYSVRVYARSNGVDAIELIRDAR